MNIDKHRIIGVSIDPVPDNQLISYLKEMQNYKIDYIHCDVMDGNFVANSTYDYNYVDVLNKKTIIPLDVHLMIEHPEKVIDKYIEAGANILTVHYESYLTRKLLVKDLDHIREKGALAGVAICPGTDINNIVDFLDHCDVVLVMSVVPGQSGQSFLESTLLKISLLDKIRKQFNFKFILAVDGGITPEIADQIKALGADMIVSGTSIYQAENRKHTIRQMRLPPFVKD